MIDLKINGIKGRLIKWLMPLIEKAVTDMFKSMSASLRLEIQSFIGKLKQEAKGTNNPYDNMVVSLLEGILGIQGVPPRSTRAYRRSKDRHE